MNVGRGDKKARKGLHLTSADKFDFPEILQFIKTVNKEI
jgi:hypothetical protein